MGETVTVVAEGSSTIRRGFDPADAASSRRPGMGRRLLGAATALSLVWLSACSTVGGVGDPLVSNNAAQIITGPQVATPNDPEHERIVASYGGLYDDPAAVEGAYPRPPSRGTTVPA